MNIDSTETKLKELQKELIKDNTLHIKPEVTIEVSFKYGAQTQTLVVDRHGGS